MKDDKSDLLTELPFGLPGQVFRSPMPFGTHDPDGQVLEEYRQKDISAIVLLASDSECMLKAGRDLRNLYSLDGYHVIYLPIEDFGTPPSLDELNQAINEVLDRIGKKENVAIHCSAGIGRTGLFVTCLAMRVLNCDSDKAIAWIRQYITGAVETLEQEEYAQSYRQYSAMF
ncbi:MAG: Dual specificity phosphatase, catalytic domain [Syntrophorhabdus sp. PtaU1.Bin153]|nr:MAG: Dual specificity phosphatase, catalytic domain [Syntrophorhabdus sp. PtaU1.Bin153]